MINPIILAEYKIAESIPELSMSEGELREINVNGRVICLAFRNGQLRACAFSCPHAGGRMSLGFTDALGNIVCPVHRYRFNLDTGYNCSGEGYHLKTYKLHARDEGLFIEL